MLNVNLEIELDDGIALQTFSIDSSQLKRSARTLIDPKRRMPTARARCSWLTQGMPLVNGIHLYYITVGRANPTLEGTATDVFAHSGWFLKPF